MIRRILWWIVKKCILYLDKDNTLQAYTFPKDEITDYHILVERCLDDVWMFGTRVTTYEELRGNNE